MKTELLTKELLEIEYLINLKTGKSIAKEYGVSRPTVIRLLKKYNSPLIHTQRKFLGIQDYKLTDIQKQFVFGTLMGDGCIALHGRNNPQGRLMIAQCLTQYDYVVWKKEILKNIVNQEIRIKTDKRGYSLASFATLVHPELTQIHKMFYQGNIKKITNNILENLTPLSIAVWYMDDGSFDQRKHTSRLWTCAFSFDENRLICKWFKEKYNLECDVKKDRHYPYISFNVENSKKLIEIVKPYIVDCMRYKIGDKESSENIRQTLGNEMKICADLHGDMQNVAEMTTSVNKN